MRYLLMLYADEKAGAEVKNMAEAVEWAKSCPGSQWGHVEVRAMVPGY